MHPGQIAGITAALIAVIITIVIYQTTSGGTATDADWLKSKWSISTDDGDETWWVDATGDDFKIRIQQDATASGWSTQDFVGGKMYTYNYRDENLFPDDAEWVDSWAGVTEKGACASEDYDLPDTGGTVDGDTAEIGFISVNLGSNGSPSQVTDGQGNVVATINSIEIGADIPTIDGCSESSRRLESSDPEHVERRLGWLEELAEWGSNTEWCGPGDSLTQSGKCPSTSNRESGYDFSQDKACRRHDHGVVVDSRASLPRFHCQVDYNLDWSTSDSSNVRYFYRSWGLARLLGCWSWEYDTYGQWYRCGWRNYGWCYRRVGYNDWDTQYGSDRYSTSTMHRSPRCGGLSGGRCYHDIPSGYGCASDTSSWMVDSNTWHNYPTSS